MATVDFTRSLTVINNAGEFPMYGLDTAPTNGVGFHTNGATRYVEGNSENTNVYRPLMMKKNGTVYKIGGTVLATVRVQFSGGSISTGGIFSVIKATYSKAFSVASTVTVVPYNMNGVAIKTYSFTVNANATSKTVNKVYNPFGVSSIRVIRVTINVNGISFEGSMFTPETETASSFNGYNIDIPVYIPYAPFKNWSVSKVTIKFYAITLESSPTSNRVKFIGTNTITVDWPFPDATTVTLKIPKDSGSDRIITATLPVMATSVNSSADSGAYTTRCKTRVEITIENISFKATFTVNTVYGNWNITRTAEIYIFRF